MSTGLDKGSAPATAPTRQPAMLRRAHGNRWAPIIFPILLAVLVITVWQVVCTARDIPEFLFPAPSTVLGAAREHAGLITSAFVVTGTEAAIAFGASATVGIVGAFILSSNRVIELSAYPYAILLQTIPSIATAPLIIIWFGVNQTSVVIIATIMAFIPVLSNTLIGLRSADRRMVELFTLFNASKRQTLLRLCIPASLPYIVSGLRVSSTMSVIGAIVAEYISGIGSGRAGLGFLITKSASRFETPLLFAAGLACAALGIIFFQLVQLTGRLLLSSWHESEMSTIS
ncbi:ABC transporter permease [Rhodococcus sp. NPDC060176]|uniref:ABC transporter permease n=1 Tax=Rhodococcus sp. NPDC060176 TaxID=3347062 RepID=UPI003655F2AA